MIYETSDSVGRQSPKLRYFHCILAILFISLSRIILDGTDIDWYCARSKKQGHRIQVDGSKIKLLLKFDNELDSHAWFQSLTKTVNDYKSWLENNPTASSSTAASPTSTQLISGPFNVVKLSTEDLHKNLATVYQEGEQKKSKKLGRKGSMLGDPSPSNVIKLCIILGLSKSFRKIMNNVRHKQGSDEEDGEIVYRNSRTEGIKGAAEGIKTAAATRMYVKNDSFESIR